MNADFIEQRANSDDSNKSAKPSAKKGRGESSEFTSQSEKTLP